MRIVYTV